VKLSHNELSFNKMFVPIEGNIFEN